MSEYGICPNCGSKLIKKEGRFGSFLSCSNFPKCRFSMDYKPGNIINDWSKVDKCPNCGSDLVKKNSSRGVFIGCSNFPKCRFSMNSQSENKNKITSSNKGSLGKCPNCGSDLVKRNGSRGVFIGCSNFPNCRFTKDFDEKGTYPFQNEKYLAKVKLTKEFVSTNLNMSIEELLTLKKWDEDISLCMDIFNNNVTAKEDNYIDSVLGYARHRRDKRSSLEYACDLMLGWVLEDCLVELLNGLGYNTSLNGADKNRKLLLDPTTDSDLKVLVNGKEVLIESVNDFTGYWKKSQWVPLRDNKYLKLKGEKSLLFGIDYVNNLFMLLNVSEREAEYIKYHRPFSKPAYAILINDNDLYNLDKVSDVLSNTLSNY